MKRLAVICICLSACFGSAQTRYHVTLLPTPFRLARSTSAATAISDTGFVAGAIIGPGNSESTAVRWDPHSAVPTYIRDPRFRSYASSWASGVNNAGEVVGTIDDGNRHGFVWNPASGVVLLPGLGDRGPSVPRAISNSGLIGGYAGFWTGLASLPAIWIGNQVQKVDRLAYTYSGDVCSFNSSNAMAGYCSTQGGAQAIKWSPDGALSHLPALLFDSGADYYLTRAYDINDFDQIVGFSSLGNSQEARRPRAVLWNFLGAIHNLGTLAGDDGSAAFAINNSGQVVGCSGDSNVPYDYCHAIIWTQAAGMVDLNTLLDSSGADWILRTATDINNSGVIVGQGFYRGQLLAFLLTPIS